MSKHWPQTVWWVKVRNKEINRRNLCYELFWALLPDFFSWVIVWFGSEKLLSALWPDWFGAQQRAFELALTEGGQFNPDTKFLLTHCICGSIASLIAGFLAALIAGENMRAPLILGFLLLAFGLLKAVMSWQYVPLWYHVAFTALIVLMAILGGKLKTNG